MKINRRECVKLGLAALGSAPLLWASSCTKNEGGSPSGSAPPAGANTIDPNTNATAKALGYHADAKQVDVEKFPKRKGPEGEKQFCNNCNFFTAAQEGWGNCLMIPGGLVAAQGWCNSWAPKAAAAAPSS